MLKNDFYTISNITETDNNKLFAEIKLNPKHKIFDGHFPGNPVVPGVVSIQIITEILSEHIKKKLMLKKARSIKFPAVINPNNNPELHFNINYSEQEDKSCKVLAQIFFQETIFLKLNGNFVYDTNSL